MRNQKCIAATLLMLFLASTASAVTRDEAAATVTTAYRLTVPAFLGGFNAIGSVLTPHREGLRASSPSKLLKPNVIKDHQLAVAGGSELSLGTAHSGVLKPGERLYLYGVGTGDDYVQLDLYTVATYVVPGTRGPTPLQAPVRFQYDGGLAGVTARQLLEDIGEWLDSEGAPGAAAGAPLRTVASDRPAAQPRAADAPTRTIRLDQTLDEVTAIMGPPEKQILLGAKTIFVYPDLKVVFMNGKVTDAE